MRVKVLAPAKVILDLETVKIIARSPDGYFCLLPHHVDFVSELAPGILSLQDRDGLEQSLAIDEGVLVKCGTEILVATRNAIKPAETGQMEHKRPAELPALDEEEIKCREIISGLESEVIDSFLKNGMK